MLGDSRVNENSGIGMYHTLFVRLHNSIEEELHRLNPGWSGNRLYHETRRVVVASLQHIAFNEFLPLVVGPGNVRKYELDLISGAHYEGKSAYNN